MSLNEVTLFRNPVIDKDNGLCVDPNRAKLSRTNRISGNEPSTHLASRSSPVFDSYHRLIPIQNSLLLGSKQVGSDLFKQLLYR